MFEQNIIQRKIRVFNHLTKYIYKLYLKFWEFALVTETTEFFSEKKI